MSILGIVGELFKPASKLIDDIHTSDEERLQLKNEFEALRIQTQSRVLEYETKLMDAQTSIINSEANGKSWLQCNWRPITMLTFLVLVVFDCLGWLKFRLATEAWSLLQIGLGGYVIGRSAEKVTEKLKK
jgi:hypothetical protein